MALRHGLRQPGARRRVSEHGRSGPGSPRSSHRGQLGGHAAIVGSGISLPRQLALVGLFNAIFVLPVVLVLVALELAGPRIEPRLAQIGDWLQERWPTVFAILAGAVGVGLTVVGVVGVTGFP